MLPAFSCAIASWSRPTWCLRGAVRFTRNNVVGPFSIVGDESLCRRFTCAGLSVDGRCASERDGQKAARNVRRVSLIAGGASWRVPCVGLLRLCGSVEEIEMTQLGDVFERGY